MKEKNIQANESEAGSGEELAQSIFEDMKAKGLIDEMTEDGETHIVIQTSKGTFIGDVDKDE